ncbi:hypothetical protein BH11PLA2_BH11PLA2_49260 [soil metagenome]
MKRKFVCFIFIYVVTLTGCSSESPSRLRLSGEITFDGNPIPFGEVLLTPDGSKGNTGPQGIAPIRDGRYDTSASDAKGYAGGPTIMRVTGFASPGGQLLCEYELKADLPRKDSTHKIDVPKDGGVAPNAKKSEI